MEIQQGLAWPKMLANIQAEPRDLPRLSNQDQEILQYLVKRHCLNPSQALAAAAAAARQGKHGRDLVPSGSSLLAAVQTQSGDL